MTLPVCLAIRVVLIAVALAAAGCGTSPTSTVSSQLVVPPPVAQAHVHDADAHDHGHHHPDHDPQSPCICAWSTTRDVWCRRCNVGYVATLRIESALLFEALDPDGHQLDVNVWECAICRANYRTNGFCADCGMGCSDTLVYFTRLTHGLARGLPASTASMSCTTCNARTGESDWCDRCNRGIVGNVAFAERSEFELTAREFAILKQAIERSTQCELCACAMVAHRDCPACLISYQ